MVLGISERQIEMDIETKYILRGINDLFYCLISLLEMLTFFLVVKLMLPITDSGKENRQKF